MSQSDPFANLYQQQAHQSQQDQEDDTPHVAPPEEVSEDNSSNPSAQNVPSNNEIQDEPQEQRKPSFEQNDEEMAPQ